MPFKTNPFSQSFEVRPSKAVVFVLIEDLQSLQDLDLCRSLLGLLRRQPRTASRAAYGRIDARCRFGFGSTFRARWRRRVGVRVGVRRHGVTPDRLDESRGR